jgi:hypothetical protein
MTKIRAGQLVRIKKFGNRDAVYGTTLERKLIGQTGRFIYVISFDDGKTYAGDFEYDPDILEHNKSKPCFSYVYVEPVDDP